MGEGRESGQNLSCLKAKKTRAQAPQGQSESVGKPESQSMAWTGGRCEDRQALNRRRGECDASRGNILGHSRRKLLQSELRGGAILKAVSPSPIASRVHPTNSNKNAILKRRSHHRLVQQRLKKGHWRRMQSRDPGEPDEGSRAHPRRHFSSPQAAGQTSIAAA